MEERAPAVVAIVVTSGTGPGLDAALASLVAQSYEELSLLVVAAGEVENVHERVAAVAPRAFVRVLPENRGFATACNEGAAMVEGAAFLLFCHDDVVLDPDAIQLMVETAFRTNAGVVTPKMVEYFDPMVLLHVGQTCDRFGVVRDRIVEGEIDHGQQDLERDVFVAPGGVTLVRRDLFTTLRGFDPLITVLGEDLDFCWRAQVAGARIVVAPLARVRHRETVATGERRVSAIGTKKQSRQDLQRRHQLLVVATGWSTWTTIVTLAMLLAIDAVEMVVALLGRDTDRAGAILGAWRWLVKQRRRVRQRRREIASIRVLTDEELRRLQVGGASRIRQFASTLVHEGYDRARGVLPEDEADEPQELPESFGVGFAAAFATDEEFDDGLDDLGNAHRGWAHLLTSFRAQAIVVALVAVAWFIGARNVVAMPLPLIGRLAPLDSWWSTWRHFFASWSPNGLGTGTPGMPGYGVLAFAGTFVFGRMGILPRLALMFAVPMGAVGVGRLLKDRVSNRARLVAAVSYLALPVGLNAIAQGRVDVLVPVALLPIIVRRLFELLDVGSFRLRPYSDPVSFGHRGWRTTEAGQRMVLVMFVALATALAPATLVAALVVGLAVAFTRLIDHERHQGVATPRLLGSLVFNVAIFLLPMTVDVVLAGRRAFEIFGLRRGAWSAPSFWMMLRGVDGTFGLGWSGWLLPAAALIGYLLARDERRRAAAAALTTYVFASVLASLSARGWMGSFAPDVDVLLALSMVMVALLVGLGVSALENDLRSSGFGWRQLLAGVNVAVLIVAVIPFAADLGSGRFDMPNASVAQSLSSLSAQTLGSYRVLWLGDPAVLPMSGWSVAPGLEAATSMNGLPDGSTLFAPPDSGTTDILLNDVREALTGETVNLGSLLASAGVSSVVVMNAAAPELAGVEEVPAHSVSGALVTALANQNDLQLELQTSSVTVYSVKSAGIIRQVNAQSTTTPAMPNGELAGPLVPGEVVEAALAPAGAWALTVNGAVTKRTTQETWYGHYEVPGVARAGAAPTLHGVFVLHQFPLNGLLALFTLFLWSIVWLGFGLVQRLEWLFTGVRRRPAGRHAKDVA